MIFIQYFNAGMLTGELTPACGDRAVVQLDGRQTLATHILDAINFNGFRRPTYAAFQIMRGRNYNDAKSITEVIKL